MNATDDTALARALGYSLKRWAALSRYLSMGFLPIALGRANWLYATFLRAANAPRHEPSAFVLLNGRDPYAYLRGLLKTLSTQPSIRICELLPHIQSMQVLMMCFRYMWVSVGD